MVEKKKKSYKVVLGALYGDEGKGNTVQWLCQREIDSDKKPVVVRFSGGPQAAHTVMRQLDNGKEIQHICSSLSSGVLLGVDTYLDENFMLDPISLMEEIDTLLIEQADAGFPLGKDWHPYIMINEWCRIITPYDVMNGRQDSKVLADGTCGKGLYATFKRCKEMFGVNPISRISIKSNDFKLSSVIKDPQKYLDRVKQYYGISQDTDENSVEWSVKEEYKALTPKELDWKFCDAFKRLEILVDKGYVKTRNEDFKRSGLYDTIIYEGSQGLLLDAENGFMPNCTPSKVGLNGLPAYVTSDRETEVYLVVRTYLTRHGWSGNDRFSITRFDGGSYFNMILNDFNPVETNVDNKWQKAFLTGKFCVWLFNKAVDRHHLDNYPVKYNLVITHADTIDTYVQQRHNVYRDKKSYMWGLAEDFNRSQNKLWPLDNCDGEEVQVANIHEFKAQITSTGVSQYCGKGYNWQCPIQNFNESWYSDSPYSDFKRC